jgi:hypothetical protein
MPSVLPSEAISGPLATRRSAVGQDRTAFARATVRIRGCQACGPEPQAAAKNRDVPQFHGSAFVSAPVSSIALARTILFLHNKFMDFRWNDRNIEHIGKRGVLPDEAELLISGARSPFPRKVDEDKWLVWGKGQGGRFLQVIFVLDEDDTI